MIQLNLLPDIKQHFMRASHLRRMTILVPLIVSAAALVLFLFLFLSVKVWQKAHINDLSKEISQAAKQLEDTPNLNRILTVQQQLKSLPELHAKKPAAVRLLGFITQTTPAAVTISKLSVSFENNSFEITGDSDKLENVNKFVDTLKFTKYKKDDQSEEKLAFSSVVLSSFGRDPKVASYKITLAFDPVIFDSGLTGLKLIVPQNFITTRSETERPAALFESQEESN